MCFASLLDRPSIAGRSARLTSNGQEATNVIDPETHRLLWQSWENSRDDASLDVAILTGRDPLYA